MSVFYFFCMLLFLFLCVLLSFVILIQESKSAGLGAMYGADRGDSLFGASTPEVLKVFTGWLAVIFMSGCIFLSFWTSARARSISSNVVQTEVIDS